MGKKIARELQRITEQQRRAALAPASTPNEDCAPDGTKRVASLLSERTPHYDRSEERYMSALDEFLEPFVAIQSGMSLGKAAKKYGIADIQRYQRCVQGFFTQLGTWNQLRWERATRSDRGTQPSAHNQNRRASSRPICPTHGRACNSPSRKRSSAEEKVGSGMFLGREKCAPSRHGVDSSCLQRIERRRGNAAA